jgi:flagellar protein FliT
MPDQPTVDLAEPPESAAPLSVLRFYAALHCASREMVEAARAGDWDSVCRLEGACTVLIARLRQESRDNPLAPHEQPLRMRFLRSILANDAEIRRIAEPMPPTLDPLNFMPTEGSLMLH